MSETWKEIVERTFERGVRDANLGYARQTRAEWIVSGENPDLYTDYWRGYTQTFSAMSPEERREAALTKRS